MPDVLWRRSAGGGSMPLERVAILDDRSLKLDHVIIEDEGEYSCEVDNAGEKIYFKLKLYKK